MLLESLDDKSNESFINSLVFIVLQFYLLLYGLKDGFMEDSIKIFKKDIFLFSFIFLQRIRFYA
jgi:hypothetical protein